MLSEEYVGYIGLQPQCGICGYQITLDETFIALLGNRDSTSFESQADPGSFTHYTLQRKTTGRWFCRLPGCIDCASSREASTIHLDCFKLFTKRYSSTDAIDRLWVASAWRCPWREAPPLRLSASATVMSAVRIAAEKLGLGHLKTLPLEIWQMIRQLSDPCPFWRLTSILNFIDILTKTSSTDTTSIAVSQIAFWERGGEPKLMSGLTTHPVLRLTIDTCGIKKVERLRGRPSYSERRFDDLAFVIEDESRFVDAVVQVKNGLLRFRLSEPANSLAIWDTPTPPSLDKCVVTLPRTPACMRFHTINTRRINGITFFLRDDRVQALHAHTPTNPCAKPTYDGLWDQSRVVWVYIPLSSNDKITAFGVQLQKCGNEYLSTDRPCFLFRTELAGDIIIGRYKGENTYDFVIDETPPSTLIYVKNELRPISVISSYPEEQIREVRNQVIPSPYRHPLPAGDLNPGWYVSWAPLDKAEHVQVFFDGCRDLCKGLLFTYENGARRAVGQCRLQVDQSLGYTNPQHLCYQEVVFQAGSEDEDTTVKVEFATELGRGRDRSAWECFHMSGTLFFFFTTSEAFINITPSESRVTSS